MRSSLPLYVAVMFGGAVVVYIVFAGFAHIKRGDIDYTPSPIVQFLAATAGCYGVIGFVWAMMSALMAGLWVATIAAMVFLGATLGRDTARNLLVLVKEDEQ